MKRKIEVTDRNGDGYFYEPDLDDGVDADSYMRQWIMPWAMHAIITVREKKGREVYRSDPGAVERFMNTPLADAKLPIMIADYEFDEWQLRGSDIVRYRVLS